MVIFTFVLFVVQQQALKVDTRKLNYQLDVLLVNRQKVFRAIKFAESSLLGDNSSKGLHVNACW
jgi:hypothetical protein